MYTLFELVSEKYQWEVPFSAHGNSIITSLPPAHPALERPERVVPILWFCIYKRCFPFPASSP